MLRLFARKPNSPPSMQALVEKLAAEGRRAPWGDIKAYAVGQQILALGLDEQREFVLAAVAWLGQRTPDQAATWPVRSALVALLRHKLPLKHDDVVALLDWSIAQTHNYWRCAPQIAKVVEDYLRAHAETPALRDRIEQLVAVIEGQSISAETRKAVARLRQASKSQSMALPLVPGEAWSDAAIAAIQAMDGPQQKSWMELLNACACASGSAPSKKWQREARPLLEAIGWPAFRQAVLAFFPLVNRPRTQPVAAQGWPIPDPYAVIAPANADILKALAWLCAWEPDGQIARALSALALSAYRKIPGIGPRCVRVGNACVWALGQMPGQEGIAQLALLKARVKINLVQKSIQKALAAAAEREGLSPEEIEEIAAPTYGLDEVGMRREALGDFVAELVVTGTDTVKLSWKRADGTRQASVPQAIKAEHAEELKELKQAVQDIRRMLPAQRDRLEHLYLEQQQWTFAAWRARYLDHPLVGTLARRLIWKFSRGDRAASGLWHEGRIVGRDGRPLEWLDDATRVEL